MADVVGPGGTAVSLAGEGLALGCGLRCPGTAKAGGCEGAEVPAVCSNSLDNHEVLGLTFDGVDLNCLEQVVA